MDMKRDFTILFLLVAGISWAQTTPEVSNLSLTDSSKRILYIGIDNYLKISGVKKPEDISVTITGGAANIRQHKLFGYIVHANAIGQSTLSMYLKGRLVMTIVYNVYPLGIPVAGLNSKRNTTIR